MLNRRIDLIMAGSEVLPLLVGGDKDPQDQDIDQTIKLGSRAMTDEIKISRFNPCDYMESDEEVVDYLVDSYFDDPDGYVYGRACQFVTEAKGDTVAHGLFERAIREIGRREKKHRAVRTELGVFRR